MKLLSRETEEKKHCLTRLGFSTYFIVLFYLGLFLFSSALRAQIYTLNSALNGTTVSTCSGNFYDSGGSSGAYSNNENYTVTFCSSTAGKKMQITFTAFALESGNDYMEIYDGSSIASTLIGTYSAASPGTITASNTCLTVRFKSDFSNTAAGWAATLSCVSSSPATTCTDYSILVVNYDNSTLTEYDNATGNFISTLATSSQGLNAPNFMYQLPNGQLLVPNGGGNNVIKLDPYSGASLGTFATGGLNFPEQIKLGNNSYLYLANSGSNNIKVYNYSGTVISTLTDANINTPIGIGFDQSSNMFVSNNISGGKINKYTTTGAAITFVSTLKTYSSGEYPRGIAMLGNDLYVNVVNSSGARVEKFTNSTGSPTTFLTLPSGAAPYAGIVWGPDGRLYVANYGQSEVDIYNSDGTFYRTITSNLSGSHGVAFTGCTPLTASGAVSNASCANNDGSVNASVTGGIKLNIQTPSNQPYTFLWSNGATTQNVSGLAAGTYYVTVTDWNKVQTIDTFAVKPPLCPCTLTVNAPANQSVCNGTSTTAVTFSGSSVAGTVYTWTNNTTSIGLAASGTGNIAAFTATNTTSSPVTATITVTPTSGSCSGTPQTFTITVSSSIATPTISATNTSVCINGSAVLSTPNNATYNYQWQSSTNNSTWSNISGATTYTYTAPTSTVGTIYYRVSITQTGNPCVAVNSSSVSVVVNAIPVVAITSNTLSICVNGSVNLTATYTGGTGTCNYQWQKSTDNGTTWSDVSGAISASYSPTITATGTPHFRAKLTCTGNGCCN